MRVIAPVLETGFQHDGHGFALWHPHEREVFCWVHLQRGSVDVNLAVDETAHHDDVVVVSDWVGDRLHGQGQHAERWSWRRIRNLHNVVHLIDLDLG